MKPVRYCPISGNQPTTYISRLELAQKICSKHRQDAGSEWNHCKVCKGQQLEQFVTIGDRQNEKA